MAFITMQLLSGHLDGLRAYFQKRDIWPVHRNGLAIVQSADVIDVSDAPESIPRYGVPF
ncbi:hypothetical protein [Acidithiobacillus sp.]|jgi:hypothetical protein|uniref:hypothetical protein n=1 Tax=Acidithiobacillus sp. TaxID=1872118 RepID=UPI0035685F5F